MITRRHGPLIAQLLVIAVLLGSLPMAASPVLVQPEPAPAFTLDICHPLPVFAVGAASSTLAASVAFSFTIVIEDRGLHLGMAQYRARAGFRSYLTGVVDAPIAFLWNIEKRK